MEDTCCKTASATGGTLQVHLDDVNGPVIAQMSIPQGGGWEELKASLSTSPSGIHNIIVMQKGDANTEIDWISFE